MRNGEKTWPTEMPAVHKIFKPTRKTLEKNRDF